MSMSVTLMVVFLRYQRARPLRWVRSEAASPNRAASPRSDQERVGVVGALPAATDGRRLLTMPSGERVLVDPSVTNEQLADQYRLDRVVTAPVMNFCTAVHLDGPLAGQTGYAVNELGARPGWRCHRAPADRPASTR